MHAVAAALACCALVQAAPSGGVVSAGSGSISAPLGSVALAAGSAVTLDFAGDGLLNVAVDQGALNALASNSGQISADGGFIETSGAKVRVDDAALITTLAASGKTGNWLVDPTDYTVAPSGGDITGAAVSTRLATTDLTLQTTSGSGGNGDIFINDSISWNAPTTLSLWAGRNIEVNRPHSSASTTWLRPCRLAW